MACLFLREHYPPCLFYDELHTILYTLLYTVLYTVLYNIFKTVLSTVPQTKLYTSANVAGLPGLIFIENFPSCFSHIVNEHFAVQLPIHPIADCNVQHTFHCTVYCGVHFPSCLRYTVSKHPIIQFTVHSSTVGCNLQHTLDCTAYKDGKVAGLFLQKYHPPCLLYNLPHTILVTVLYTVILIVLFNIGQPHLRLCTMLYTV